MTLYFDSFRPLHIYCKLSLTAPIRKSKDSETQNSTYVFQKRQYLLNVALILIVVISNAYCSYSHIKDLLMLQKVSTAVNTAVISKSYILSTGINVFASLLSIYGIIKTKPDYPPLLILHEILRRINETIAPESKIAQFKIVAFVYIFSTILLDVLTFLLLPLPSKFLRGALLAGYMSRLVNDSVLIQYGEIVFCLRNQFVRINAELRQELEYYFRRDYLRLISKRHYEILPARCASRRRVGELFQLFWETCRGVQFVNTIYGNIILGMIVQSSFCMVLLTHIAVIPLFTVPHVLTLSQKNSHIISSFWVLIYCCQLFLLVIPPALASIEGSRTAVIACKYLTLSTDKYFLEELTEFVTTQNPTFFELTATRLLTIKRPLLISVIGTTATSLMLLIQTKHAFSELQIQ